jgi:hypothetical protein
MSDKGTSFPLAYRHGYAAPCLLKEADGGLVGKMEDWALSEKNILKYGPMISKAFEAFTPIFEGPQEDNKPGLMSPANPERSWWDKFRLSNLTPEYDGHGPAKPADHSYSGPASMVGNYTLSKPKPADIYRSKQGGGAYQRVDLSDKEKFNKLFEEKILPRYPHATRKEVIQLSKDLGGRLPLEPSSQSVAFEQALKKAHADKDYAKIRRLSNYIAHSSSRDKVKAQVIREARDKASTAIGKAAPWALGGIAALAPLASLLLSKKQTTPQATPQARPQQVPARSPLSEAMYRRLGQSNQPVRLAQPTYRRMPL